MLFIRAWYGFLGLFGKPLNWLIVTRPMIKLSKACKKYNKSPDELYSKYHYGISWDDAEKINKIAGDYAITKMAKIKVQFETYNNELNEDDYYDLIYLYNSIGYIKGIISQR